MVSRYLDFFSGTCGSDVDINVWPLETNEYA